MDLSIGWRRAALSRDPVSRRGSYRTTFGYHRNRERRARACPRQQVDRGRSVRCGVVGSPGGRAVRPGRYRAHLSRLRSHRIPCRDCALGAAFVAGDQDRHRFHGCSLDHVVLCCAADCGSHKCHRRTGDRGDDHICSGRELFLAQCGRSVVGDVRFRAHSRLRLRQRAAGDRAASECGRARARGFQHRRGDWAGRDCGPHLSTSAVVGSDRSPGRGTQGTASGGGLLLFSGDLIGRALLAHGTHRAPLKHRPVALAPCAIRPWSTALSRTGGDRSRQRCPTASDQRRPEARFITQKLKLKVNEAKSAVARPQERKFLGFSFTAGPNIKRTIAPKTLGRLKQRIRDITRRAKGVSIKKTMEEMAQYMRGWRGYFSFCETPEVLIALTRWVRLRLRAALWRQWKTPGRRRAALIALGVSGGLRNTARSGRRPWPIALSQALSVGLSNPHFKSLGLPSLIDAR